jgi:hypothetical protein
MPINDASVNFPVEDESLTGALRPRNSPPTRKMTESAGSGDKFSRAAAAR